MSFSGLMLTGDGKRELADAECGKKFCITHIVLGDGKYAGEAAEIEELVHPVMEVPVKRITRSNEEVILECDFNSLDVPQAFYWTEIGIIANEKLCYYDNAKETAEFINPQSDVIIKQKRMRFVLLISSGIEVNVTVASSLYVTFSDLQTGAFAKVVNDDTITEEGYVADARIVELHGREIDAVENSLNILMEELYNAATDSDIDRIINGTYTDTEESGLVDIASESDIDEIIGGSYQDAEEDAETADFEEIEEIINKTFN